MAELKESIQKRILESLSMVLTGKALDQLKNQILDTGECVSLTNQDKDLGNHFKLYILQNDSYNFLFDIYFFHQGSPQIEKENTLHAFQALRSITLSQSTSIAFLKHFIDFYLQHQSSSIKIEAILSIVFLLSRLINDIKDEETVSKSILDSSLNKLLISAIIDTDPNIRYHVLNSLYDEKSFDNVIALPKNFNMILRCLSDECIEIREFSALFLSRLSTQNIENKSKILLFINETFNEIKMEIYPDRFEKSIRLINHLISRLPNTIDCDSLELLTFFHSKFDEWSHDVALSSNILVLFGQLASRSNSQSFLLLTSLIPFLIESIQDSYHSQLNKTAIWALGQIIENTGYVIEPYKKYPNLLQTLLTILQRENSKQTRRDAIKALGLIGTCFRFNRQVF